MMLFKRAVLIVMLLCIIPSVVATPVIYDMCNSTAAGSGLNIGSSGTGKGMYFAQRILINSTINITNISAYIVTVPTWYTGTGSSWIYLVGNMTNGSAYPNMSDIKITTQPKLNTALPGGGNWSNYSVTGGVSIDAGYYWIVHYQNQTNATINKYFAPSSNLGASCYGVLKSAWYDNGWDTATYATEVMAYRIYNDTIYTAAGLVCSITNPSASGQHNNTQINITAGCDSTNASYTIYFDTVNPPVTAVIDSNISNETSDNWDYASLVWTNETIMVYLLNASLADSAIHQYNGTNNGVTATQGIVAGGYLFDGASYVTPPTQNLVHNDSSIHYSSYGIGAWFKPLTIPSGMSQSKLFHKRREISLAYIPSSNEFKCYFSNQSTDFATAEVSTYTFSGSLYNTWNYVYCDCDNTTGNINLYFNGVLRNSSTLKANATSNNLCYSYINVPYVGRDHSTVQYFNGTMDDIRMYNTTHSADWVNMTYQSVANYATLISFGTEEDLTRMNRRKNITINNPGSTTLLNFPLMVNVTYDSDMQNNFSDLRFYDNSGNLLDAEMEFKTDNSYTVLWLRTNLTAGTNKIIMRYGKGVNFWTTNVTTNQIYYYSAICRANNTGTNSTSSGVGSWTFDNVMPVISLRPGNEFGADYVLNQSPYDKNVDLELRFTDNIGLFAYEVEINSPNGSNYYNNTNASMGAATDTNFSANFNVSNISNGVYCANISVADIHTDSIIEEYEVLKTSNSLVFNDNGLDIQVISKDARAIETTKEIDRYKFDFSYEKPPENYEYIVKSDYGSVYFIPESRYKAHFIVFDWENFRGNWVDFEGVEGKPIVQDLQDGTFKVTIPNTMGEKSASFESVGGLNILNENYCFWIGSQYDYSPATVLSGVNHSISINLSGDNFFNLSEGSLEYDGTNYTFDATYSASWLLNASGVIAASNGTEAYSWWINLTNWDGSSHIISVNLSEIVTFWNVSYCAATGFNLTVINFTLLYEQNVSQNLTEDIDLELFAWSGDPSNNFTKNLNWSEVENFSICLSTNVTIQSNLYFIHTNPDSFSHRYYWFNKTLNSSNPYNYFAYNFNETNITSLLRITARNKETYRYYPEILVWLERRYLDEGVWRIVQMDLSDDYGLAIFDVIDKSVDYRLKFYDISNNLLKTSEPMKFSCDSGLCELVAEIDPSGEGTTGADLRIYWNYDNTTKNVSINWSDAYLVTSEVRVWVGKQAYNGELTICNTTQAGSSGSSACNLSGYTGTAIVRVWRTASPSTPAASWYIELAKVFSLSDAAGTSLGVFMSFILIVVIIGLGLFSPVATIIMSVVGIIVVSLLGVTSGLTYAVIGVASVMGLVLSLKMRR